MITPPAISSDECAAFKHFYESEQYNSTHDLPEMVMRRLSQIGLVMQCSSGCYESTSFGTAYIKSLTYSPNSKLKRFRYICEAAPGVRTSTGLKGLIFSEADLREISELLSD